MGNFVSGVLQNLVADVVVLVSGGLLALLFALRARLRLLGALIRLSRSGVSNIFLQRSEYVSKRSRTVGEFIESANRDFTYVGVDFSLATEQSRIDKSFRILIDKGCKVTVVLLDSAASAELTEYLEDHFAFARNTIAARAQHAVDYFLAMRASLAPSKTSQLDIRLHRLPLTASAFILDGNEPSRMMLVDQKWYAAGRDKSLGIEFTKKKDDGALQEAIFMSFSRLVGMSRQI
jgi:hypothetical protein